MMRHAYRCLCCPAATSSSAAVSVVNGCRGTKQMPNGIKFGSNLHAFGQTPFRFNLPSSMTVARNGSKTTHLKRRRRPGVRHYTDATSPRFFDPTAFHNLAFYRGYIQWRFNPLLPTSALRNDKFLEDALALSLPENDVKNVFAALWLAACDQELFERNFDTVQTLCKAMSDIPETLSAEQILILFLLQILSPRSDSSSSADLLLHPSFKRRAENVLVDGAMQSWNLTDFALINRSSQSFWGNEHSEANRGFVRASIYSVVREQLDKQFEQINSTVLHDLCCYFVFRAPDNISATRTDSKRYRSAAYKYTRWTCVQLLDNFLSTQRRDFQQSPGAWAQVAFMQSRTRIFHRGFAEALLFRMSASDPASFVDVLSLYNIYHILLYLVTVADLDYHYRVVDALVARIKSLRHSFATYPVLLASLVRSLAILDCYDDELLSALFSLDMSACSDGPAPAERRLNITQRLHYHWLRHVDCSIAIEHRSYTGPRLADLAALEPVVDVMAEADSSSSMQRLLLERRLLEFILRLQPGMNMSYVYVGSVLPHLHTRSVVLLKNRAGYLQPIGQAFGNSGSGDVTNADNQQDNQFVVILAPGLRTQLKVYDAKFNLTEDTYTHGKQIALRRQLERSGFKVVEFQPSVLAGNVVQNIRRILQLKPVPDA